MIVTELNPSTNEWETRLSERGWLRFETERGTFELLDDGDRIQLRCSEIGASLAIKPVVSNVIEIRIEKA